MKQLIVQFLYLLWSLLCLLFSLYLGRREESKILLDRGFSVSMHVKGSHSPGLYLLHQNVFCLPFGAFRFVQPRPCCLKVFFHCLDVDSTAVQTADRCLQAQGQANPQMNILMSHAEQLLENRNRLSGVFIPFGTRVPHKCNIALC